MFTQIDGAQWLGDGYGGPTPGSLNYYVTSI